MNRPLPLLLFVLLWTGLPAAPIVENHPQKDMILQALQRLVDTRAKAPENHFFLVRRADGKDWVYWREGRLLWSAELEPYYEKKGLAEVRARAIWAGRLSTPQKAIDLATGVVPQPEDVGISSYLVTKQFVADIVSDCVLDGEMLTVRK